MGKFLIGGLLLAAVAAVAVQYPEIQRYLKIKRM